MSERNVVLLAGQSASTNVVYHALRDEFPLVAVMVEAPVPGKVFLWRRVRKLGWRTVAGQLLFKTLVLPLLNLKSRRRIQAIKKQFGLVDAPIDAVNVTRVDSVNSPQ